MSYAKLFENKSITSLIVLFSFPTIFSLVLESLVSMIDTVFAGHLGEMSEIVLSAMGILSPLLQVLLAAQLIFGVSTSLVISKQLGQNNEKKIGEVFTVGFYGCLFVSVGISLLIFLFEDSLLNLLGTNAEVKVFVKQYLNRALIFNVFNSLGYMLVNMIRVFGYPKMEILIGILSTISNIGLNILFTFILGFGFKGIATASLISSLIYFGCAALFLIVKQRWMMINPFQLKDLKGTFMLIVKIGFVQFLMQALTSVSGFVMNHQLIELGQDLAIGAFAICQNFNMMMLLPLIGLTQGSQAVIAYFIGCGDVEKEQKVKRKIIAYSLIYAILISSFSLLSSEFCLRLFTEELQIISVGVSILQMLMIGFPFMAIIYALITFMQVSKEEVTASRLEVFRQVVFLIPLIFLLSRISDFNKLSVFLAYPLSNMIIVVLYFNKLKSSY